MVVRTAFSAWWVSSVDSLSELVGNVISSFAVGDSSRAFVGWDDCRAMTGIHATEFSSLFFRICGGLYIGVSRGWEDSWTVLLGELLSSNLSTVSACSRFCTEFALRTASCCFGDNWRKAVLSFSSAVSMMLGVLVVAGEAVWGKALPGSGLSFWTACVSSRVDTSEILKVSAL